MPLVNPLPILYEAQRQGVAVASFNVHNLETIQAVIAGAEAENCPVILQTTPGTLKHAGISAVGAIVRQLAAETSLPIALHVDHCKSYETILQCIRNGYTSVMIDSADLPYSENIAMVRKVVEAAHAVGVMVEGELGRIGGTEDELTTDERSATFTVPGEAKDFVKETGLDTLAVAIGTAHGEYHGVPDLDFPRLSAIREVVSVPLVLHGASGVPDEQIRESLSRGVCKINIATELKIPMARAIKECFANNPKENDPRHYMGAAKEAVTAVVREKIRLCGGTGFAAKLPR